MSPSEPAASPFTPLVKRVRVRATPEAAFRRFTAEIASWWPLASHSVHQAEAATVTFEGRVGGRIVETAKSGATCTWGTVTAWDPPRRVAFTWHPGREPDTAQDVELTFEPEPAGKHGSTHTRVRLVHTGFERLGALAKKARRGYPLGWAYVLGLYGRRQNPLQWALAGATALLLAWHRRKRKAEPEAPEVTGA